MFEFKHPNYYKKIKKENRLTNKENYDKGLDKYYGLLDLAEKYDILKKVSTRYELPDGSKQYVYDGRITTDPWEIEQAKKASS